MSVMDELRASMQRLQSLSSPAPTTTATPATEPAKQPEPEKKPGFLRMSPALEAYAASIKLPGADAKLNPQQRQNVGVLSDGMERYAQSIKLPGQGDGGGFLKMPG